MGIWGRRGKGFAWRRVAGFGRQWKLAYIFKIVAKTYKEWTIKRLLNGGSKLDDKFVWNWFKWNSCWLGNIKKAFLFMI